MSDRIRNLIDAGRLAREPAPGDEIAGLCETRSWRASARTGGWCVRTTRDGLHRWRSSARETEENLPGVIYVPVYPGCRLQPYQYMPGAPPVACPQPYGFTVP